MFGASDASSPPAPLYHLNKSGEAYQAASQDALRLPSAKDVKFIAFLLALVSGKSVASAALQMQ